MYILRYYAYDCLIYRQGGPGTLGRYHFPSLWFEVVGNGTRKLDFLSFLSNSKFSIGRQVWIIRLILDMSLALIISLLSSIVLANQTSEERAVIPTVNVVEGDTVTLSCNLQEGYTLTWKFYHNGKNVTLVEKYQNGSLYYHDHTQANHFNMKGGNLTIIKINSTKEGEYHCELRNTFTVNRGLVYIRVFVKPHETNIISVAKTLTQRTPNATAALCTSGGGDPASELTWMNGSVPMTGPNTVVATRIIEGRTYSETYRQLVINSPTRYDHNRTFTCVIEHPAFHEPKMLHHIVLVNHHPSNVTIWSDVATKTIFCKSDGYPNPTYSWNIPGYLENVTGSSLVWTDRPGDGMLQCTADNGFPPNVTLKVRVQDLGFSTAKENSSSFLVIFISLLFFSHFLPCWRRIDWNVERSRTPGRCELPPCRTTVQAHPWHGVRRKWGTDIPILTSWIAFESGTYWSGGGCPNDHQR